MIELERTFLVKFLPDNLSNYPSKEIWDNYIPDTDPHPVLRLRKLGEKYELTKKQPVAENDSSAQIEDTIILSALEFEAIHTLPGKEVRKIRYYVPHLNGKAEIDVFQSNLTGLVLADFEFTSEQEKDAFIMPNFCLCEVTQEHFLAGGRLAGRSFSDIEPSLVKFGYTKI
ncbi:MAG: hypothetical protein AAB511_00070 [Patescibacteria group bacterium]